MGANRGIKLVVVGGVVVVCLLLCLFLIQALEDKKIPINRIRLVCYIFKIMT